MKAWVLTGSGIRDGVGNGQTGPMVPADGERTGLNLWLREDPEQPVPEKVLEDSKRLVTWILRDRGVTADLDFDLAVADAPEQGGMQW